MKVRVEGLTKQFGAQACRRTSRDFRGCRGASRLARPVGSADHILRIIAGSNADDGRYCRRRGHHQIPGASVVRIRIPELRAIRHMSVRENVAFGSACAEPRSGHPGPCRRAARLVQLRDSVTVSGQLSAGNASAWICRAWRLIQASVLDEPSAPRRTRARRAARVVAPSARPDI